jgi:hypothetical protein
MPKMPFYPKNFHSVVSMRLTDYVERINNYCISYFGPIDEYIIQLEALRPIIESQLNGINIIIACKDELAKNMSNSISSNDIKHIKEKSVYIRELRCDFVHHPILSLLEESNIKIPENSFPIKEIITKMAVVISSGINPPTEPLSQERLDTAISYCRNLKYEVAVDGDIRNAGLVVGVESAKLYKAAVNGIQTRLIPTGIGTNLYKLMFSEINVLKF